MDPELEFQQLVRKSGIVFTTNLGQGLEEWVLAVTTPTLSKTQVATQADLVAAGFIRAEALKRLEAERDRLLELLKIADANIQGGHAEKQAREAEVRAREEALLAQIAALEARAAIGEAWKQGETAGVIARNRGEAAETNPYDGAGDALATEGHQAWRHGWRLRDVLLDLNTRLKAALAAHQALEGQHAAQGDALAQAEQRLVEAAALDGQRREAIAQLEARLDAALSRGRQLDEALKAIFTEAPHSPTCALWTAAMADGKASVIACDCWRSRLAAFGSAGAGTSAAAPPASAALPPTSSAPPPSSPALPPTSSAPPPTSPAPPP